MMCANIQGLTNNLAELEPIIEECDFDFLILTETHETEDTPNSATEIKNYKAIKCLSNSRRTGGTNIYVKNKTKIIKLFEKYIESKIWILAVKCNFNNAEIIIVGVYRSPNSSEREFCDIFNECCEVLTERQAKIVFAGDFNIDWMQNSTYKREIESTLNDNGLRQIVSEPTRITVNTKTLIDLVITNVPEIAAVIQPKHKISDHETILVQIKCDTPNRVCDKKEIKFLNYNKELFNTQLSSQNINISSLNNIQQNANGIESAIKSVISSNLKTRTININNTNEWFTNELRNLKRIKIEAYRRAKLSNTSDAWSEYRNARNKYKTEVNNAKNNYIKNRIRNASNQKEMWKEIKKLVLKKPQIKPDMIIYDGNECSDDSENANNLNKYFVNSVKTINQSIDNVEYQNHIPQSTTNFKFREVSLQELKNICKSLKNKADFDKISPKIILDNWEILGPAIKCVINESLKTGIFPEAWKDSLVTPVEKILNTNKCEEFRPINCLKTLEKILESVVKQQLEDYFEKNNLFTKYQSGFRKHHSCETAVNHIICDWKKSGKKSKIIALFLDFKRAFETIERNILLNKLHKYGIIGTEYKWFESYLTNRKQRTKFNDKVSEYVNVDLGVPQGSILGALLFIIYINDIVNVLKKCKITLYADDTLIYIQGEDIETCKRELENEIKNVNNWLKMNKLKLNEEKTKMMVINSNSEINIEINGKLIENVKIIKYLGVIIDKNLNFNEHIEYVCKKIGKKIGFIKTLRNKMDILTAIQIHNTMIKPHFEYCSTILYTCCNQSQLNRLQMLQNKCMRTILKMRRDTSIEFMLQTLKWLNIEQKLKLNTLINIFKIKHNLAPKYMTENIAYVGEVQTYLLRNATDFRIQRQRTTAAQNCLFFKGLKLYNDLPMEAKRERNIHVFIRMCKEYIANRNI